MPEAPTMPETTSTQAVAPPPSPAREVAANFARSDLRNTPEFKERFSAFRAKAKPGGTETQKPTPAKPEPNLEQKAAPKPEAKPAAKPQVKAEPEIGEDPEEAQPQENASEEAETTETPETETKAEAKPEPKADEKGKKLSPWRLVDQWKDKASKLERELAEIKGKAIPEVDSKQLTERLQKAEARVKEYEEQIRLKDYESSDDYNRDYVQPYKAEYAKVLTQLQTIPVNQPDGTVRQLNASDIFDLLGKPAYEMETLAKEKFGEFSATVVRRVEKLQDLFDRSKEAVEKNKKEGAEILKQRTEQQTRHQQELEKTVTSEWEEANRDAVTDPKYGKYLTIREGEPEWNQRLAKGFEMTDRAFNAPNPRDPRLTPEQRKKAIRMQAAVRYRSAAFGPLRYTVEKLTAELEAKDKELAEYKSSEPGSAGGTKSNATKQEGTKGYTMADVRHGLMKYAK